MKYWTREEFRTLRATFEFENIVEASWELEDQWDGQKLFILQGPNQFPIQSEEELTAFAMGMRMQRGSKKKREQALNELQKLLENPFFINTKGDECYRCVSGKTIVVKENRHA